MFMVLVAVTVSACGRPSHEVSVQRSSDKVVSCFQLASEYQANLDSIGINRAESLQREKNNLASVAGVLVGGVGILAGMDLGTAERAELDAFIARNRRIAELSADRDCPPLEPDMESVVQAIAAAEATREAESLPTRPEDK